MECIIWTLILSKDWFKMAGHVTIRSMGLIAWAVGSSSLRKANPDIWALCVVPCCQCAVMHRITVSANKSTTRNIFSNHRKTKKLPEHWRYSTQTKSKPYQCHDTLVPYVARSSVVMLMTINNLYEIWLYIYIYSSKQFKIWRVGHSFAWKMHINLWLWIIITGRNRLELKTVLLYSPDMFSTTEVK